MSVEKFIKDSQLKMEVERLSERKDSFMDGFHWKVTLTRTLTYAGTSESFVTEYTTGGALLELATKPNFLSSFSTQHDRNLVKDNLTSIFYDGKLKRFRRYYGPMTVALEGACQVWTKPKAPTIEAVLSCLKTDCEVLNYPNFETWALAFGYDTDSRKAEKIYNHCLKNAVELRYFLGRWFNDFENLDLD